MHTLVFPLALFALLVVPGEHQASIASLKQVTGHTSYMQTDTLAVYTGHSAGKSYDISVVCVKKSLSLIVMFSSNREPLEPPRAPES